MALPTASTPYPLGPYSLTLPSGTYWFPSSFRADALIPGKASHALRKADFNPAWRLDSDGKRTPGPLTLTGDLIPHATEDGLKQAARTLQAAVQTATALVRDNGDGTTREISIDGGRAQISMTSRQHYRATVTLYPTGATLTTGVAATVPTLRARVTTSGVARATSQGATRATLRP